MYHSYPVAYQQYLAERIRRSRSYNQTTKLLYNQISSKRMNQEKIIQKRQLKRKSHQEPTHATQITKTQRAKNTKSLTVPITDPKLTNHPFTHLNVADYVLILNQQPNLSTSVHNGDSRRVTCSSKQSRHLLRTTINEQHIYY